MNKDKAALESLLTALAKRAADVLLAKSESSQRATNLAGASHGQHNLRARTYRAVTANKLLLAIGELQKALKENDMTSAAWTTISLMEVAFHGDFAQYIPSVDIDSSVINECVDALKRANTLSESERCILYQQTVADVLKEHPRWTITAARQKAAQRLSVDPQTIVKFTYDPRDKQTVL